MKLFRNHSTCFNKNLYNKRNNKQNNKTSGRIKQQRVTLGERLGDSVAIKEPLPSESRVVKQGGSFLNDGDLVRIVDSATPSTVSNAEPKNVAKAPSAPQARS